MNTTEITLIITTKDGNQHEEQRTVSDEVLDDAFALMRYERAQIEADPNVVKVEITFKN